ncbi:hypothetical protein [Nocardia sp. NPDC059228]|uniref:hypothetical protein n=1 Tax=Nocardia sp. NPDC059228 TaxID=3346777 RepID=UPI00367BAF7E
MIAGRRRPGTSATARRDVGHLTDFTATPRMLFIAALAVPIGALGGCAAWALSRLIALITNLVWYQRLSADPVSAGATHHNPLLILGARPGS